MRIYVGNMPFSMDEGQLHDLFATYGEVNSANVITDRETGRSRGFGFVEMQDTEGKAAISSLADQEIGGRKLNVNEARPRENRNRGGFNQGGRW